MCNVIVHSVVPLEVAGEVYIAGENQIFELGIFVGRNGSVVVVLGQRSSALIALIIAQSRDHWRLNCL